MTLSCGLKQLQQGQSLHLPPGPEPSDVTGNLSTGGSRANSARMSAPMIYQPRSEARGQSLSRVFKQMSPSLLVHLVWCPVTAVCGDRENPLWTLQCICTLCVSPHVCLCVPMWLCCVLSLFFSVTALAPSYLSAPATPFPAHVIRVCVGASCWLDSPGA